MYVADLGKKLTTCGPRAFLRCLLYQLSAGLVPNAVMMVKPNNAGDGAMGQPHTNSASAATVRGGAVDEGVLGSDGEFDIARSWA